MALELSVVILAKNEQARIKDCLESIKGWANEIIIVDDGSTDATISIAKEYTKSIFSRQMDLEGKQRNFGASHASNDWILILDCDERMTKELKEEISNSLPNAPKEVVAYWASQFNYFGDIYLEHGGWSTPHIRLYNKKHVRWSEADFDVVHPGIKIEPGFKGGHFKGKTIHYSFKNMEDFIHKINRYSTLEATKWYLDKRKMSLGKAVWRTVDRFFRRFVGKKGYKDGYYGFAAALLSGLHEYFAYSKYKEIKEKGYYLKNKNSGS